MKRNYTFIPLLLLLIVAIVACSNNSSKSAADNDSEGDATKATVQVPQFSADSAYQYIQTQADFGPRVPNTAAHKACGEFLAKKLEEFGAKVYNQHADLVAYDNTILKARNVIGAYNPESKRRVLLCAHWDSRPYADQDADKHHQYQERGAATGVKPALYPHVFHGQRQSRLIAENRFVLGAMVTEGAPDILHQRNGSHIADQQDNLQDTGKDRLGVSVVRIQPIHMCGKRLVQPCRHNDEQSDGKRQR